MPALAKYDSVRSQHARRALYVDRQLYPARLLVRLKREEGRLQMDFDAAPSADDRFAASVALDRVRGRILEVLGVPKRPASPAEKTRSLSSQGQIADAVLVSVDSNPEPIPAEPAESVE
jgi:hypothetical protein